MRSLVLVLVVFFVSMTFLPLHVMSETPSIHKQTGDIVDEISPTEIGSGCRGDCPQDVPFISKKSSPPIPSYTKSSTGNGEVTVSYRTDTGYDLDVYTEGGIKFNINVPDYDKTLVTEANLTLWVYDIDRDADPNGACGIEIDGVYFEGLRLGILNGQSNQWSLNTFNIPTYIIKKGENHIWIDISIGHKGCWLMECDWGELTIVKNVPVPTIQSVKGEMIAPDQFGTIVSVTFQKENSINNKWLLNCTLQLNNNASISQTFENWEGLVKENPYSNPPINNPRGENLWKWAHGYFIINLSSYNLPRFVKNVPYTINAKLEYNENGFQLNSESKSYSGTIPLPVVVLHGYGPELPLPLYRKLLMGYPGIHSSAPSSRIEKDSWLAHQGNYWGYITLFKDLFYALSTHKYLYYGDFPESYDPYITLWGPHPRTPYIGTSSYSYGTTNDLILDYNRVYHEVREHSYADKFSVIALSSGGLCAIFWASHDNTRINKIINVGTPHEGLVKFSEEVFKAQLKSNKQFANRSDVINTVLTIHPPEQENTNSGGESNLLSWLSPKWNAIFWNYDIALINPSNRPKSLESNPYFANTFNYQYQSNIQYYLLYVRNQPTQYKVAIGLPRYTYSYNPDTYTGWYRYITTIMEPSSGDGYVFWESAANKNGPTTSNIHRIQVTPAKTYKPSDLHAKLLTDPAVQTEIINILNQD